MRMKCMAIGALAALMTATCFSQAPTGAVLSSAGVSDTKTAANATQLIGVWHGDFRGLPWITVNLTQDRGALSGAVLFYLHRKMPGSAETATAGTPEPMLEPQLDGKVLTFLVSPRHADLPQTSDDPPIRMTMELIDGDHARLVNTEDPHLTGLLTRISR